MPRLTSTQAKQVSGRRFAASQERLLRAHATNPMMQAAMREDTARATAPVATRTQAKFNLAAFITTVKQIPDGFYALTGKDGVTIFFFEVREEGNRNWVYRLHGAPGDFRRERMSYQWMAAAATRIAADARGAAVLFGKETNICGRCNSPLTRADSRARGLGPTCAKVYGL